MHDLTIAAVCMRAPPGSLQENLDRTRAWVVEASGRGAHMVCFPELSLTGYVMERPEDLYGEKGYQEVLSHIVGMARETGVVILAGLIEPLKGEKPFIGHAAAGPQGLIGIHRKTHLAPNEKQAFSAGEDLTVFSCPEATFGMELCYEAHFPEISTVLALKGAEIIFMPHASPRGGPRSKLKSWLRHLRARAFDNGLYVVATNQAGSSLRGPSFPGVAVVVGPDGRVLAQYDGGEEGIVYAHITGEALRDVRGHRMKYFLPNRRPGLYRKASADQAKGGLRSRVRKSKNPDPEGPASIKPVGD